MRFYPRLYRLIAYLDAYKLAKQNNLSIAGYHDLMIDNIDEMTDIRLRALKKIEKVKLRVARAYNKRVKGKLFHVGKLVWNKILPLGTKSSKFSKWSLGWEGLYKIVNVIFGNSYMVECKESIYPGLLM